MEVESHPEKDCSALGGLFQYIINDLKGGTPIWEDFLAKATKLHSQLRMTASVSAAFLDSFQKVADMATNTKGATKEVGKALTRLCLRQRSVEAKLKSFTSSIMDHLVLPLQDKMEDWKKMSLQLDKDHSKEFKRARQEIKKMSTDTLRLQKKVKKGARYETQRSLDCALQDVSDKYLLLEETEKQAVRRALVEERGRFCLLVACLRPVVQEELLMLHEIAHLQEILDSLSRLTADPQRLPSASEQVIADLKGSDWAFQTPPSSPSSLGSRKSSMCSISSFNSSSSGSTKSHSPSHRSLSQQPAVGPPLRLSSVSSQDSGFTSQDTLFLRPPSPRSAADVSAQVCDPGGTACASSTPASPFPPSVTSTWPNLQDTLQFERAMSSVLKCQRPHTISSAYERAGHQARPLLTAETFQPLEGDLQSGSNHSGSADTLTSTSEGDEAPPTRGPRPPVPLRTTSAVPSLPERPAALKPVQPPRVPTLPEFHEPLACQVLPIYANVGDVMAPPGWPNSGPASQDSRTRNMEACNAARAEDADVLRMHESYKTYSPSSASTRYEGLSGSSTLPAKSSVRRSSQLPPPPPPIRRTPSISSNQGPSVASPQHPRIAPDRVDYNGGDRAADDASSRAKLIQALNARFSKPLEQAGLRFSLPACRPEEGPDLLLPDPPVADVAEGEPPDFPDPPPLPEQPSGQPGRQAEKKLLRAHTIGYSERDALIQSLNAKLSMRAAGHPQAGVAGRPLQEGAQRGPRGATDLEQTLLKKEQRAGPEPAEARRSRSVGPCAEKRGTASVERRQFLNTLNARLAEQRSGGGASGQSPRRGSLQTELGNRRKSTDADRASRVQSWLAGRGSVDLTACRESLLDQIRRGTALKRVASQSDRSMPRLL